MEYFKDRSKIVVSSRKIIDYLLNPNHPDGWSKAKLFYEVGFHPENWEEFQDRITEHAQGAELLTEVKTQFGTKIVVIGVLKTPSGKELTLNSVWMIYENVPILVTIYPASK